MTVFVCPFVCLSVREHISETTLQVFTNFLCMLPEAATRPFSGGVAICYVFPVLALYLHVSQGCSTSRLIERSARAALGLAMNCAQ